jgi:hypothetical protein
MIGNLIEVTSKGQIFDTCFHNIDFREYLFVLKRTTRFSNYVREVPTINERLNFGKTITFDIPKLGDFLWKSYLEVVLPDLSEKSEEARVLAESRGLTFVGPQFYWVHEIGNHIFERVELLIDGVSIAHYSNNYAMIKTQEKSNVRTDAYLSQMIARDNLSVSGEKIIYAPLHFWFNEEIHQALPLFRMENTRVQIRVTIRSLDDLIISNMLLDSRNTETQYTAGKSPWAPASLGSNISQPMVKFSGARYFGINPVDQTLPQIYGYNGILTSNQGRYISEVDNGTQNDYSIPSCTLICHCFDIGNEEKAMIMNQPSQNYYIYQIQEISYQGQSIRGRVQSELVFSNPVAHLHWFYRNPEVVGVFNNYVNLSKKFINSASKMPIYPVIPTIGYYQYQNLPPFYNQNAEWLTSAKIKISNQDRQEGNADLYRDVIYQTRKGITPSTYERYIYSYHFGKEVANKKRFTACLNFDKLNKLYLESEFDYDPDDTLNLDTDIYIVAENLNILVFSGGKASLLFD